MENGVNVAEIWSYHTIGDQTRFTLVHRAPASETRKGQEPHRPAPRPAAAGPAAPARPAAPNPRREPEAAKRKVATRSAAKASRTKRSAAPKPASSRTQKRK